MNMCRSNDQCNLKLVCWICYMSMSALSLQLRGASARPILIDIYTYGQNIEDYINGRLCWSNYVLYLCLWSIKVILLIYCNSTMLRGMFTHPLHVMLRGMLNHPLHDSDAEHNNLKNMLRGMITHCLHVMLRGMLNHPLHNIDAEHNNPSNMLRGMITHPVHVCWRTCIPSDSW
jgi:hypothetical protein